MPSHMSSQTRAKVVSDRLTAAGVVVDLSTGFSGWKNREAALIASLSPEMIADAELLACIDPGRANPFERLPPE